MAEFCDTHAHLDYPDFAPDLPQIIERARAAGVTRIISVGTSLGSSERALHISEQYSNVFAVIGWHPSDVLEAPDDIRPALRTLAAHPKCVAIGETGLDYSRLPSKQPGGTPADDVAIKQKQAAIFQQQLEVAAEFGLNCVVHQREAFEDTLAIMASFAGKLRAVFHCFVDTPEMARRVLDAGHLVSFTGIVTFKNGQNVRDTLKTIPLGRFMLETDCPFLAPVPFRGKRCEPAYVMDTARAVAEVKGCSMGDLAQATSGAANAFFKKIGNKI